MTGVVTGGRDSPVCAGGRQGMGAARDPGQALAVPEAACLKLRALTVLVLVSGDPVAVAGFLPSPSHQAPTGPTLLKSVRVC